MIPQKLKIDNNFKEKLNLINKTKIYPTSKSESIIKPKLKFKVTQDNTPFISTHPKLSINKDKKLDKTIVKSDIPDIKEIKPKEFKKLVLKEVNESSMMWDSFDDSIKKIILSEIVEKYYLYKKWKFNSVSFLFGFFFALLLILLIRIIN